MTTSLGLTSADWHGSHVQSAIESMGLYAADAIAAHCVAGSFSKASFTLVLPPPDGTMRKVRQRYTARTTRTTPAIHEPYTPSTAWIDDTQPEHAEKIQKGFPHEIPQPFFSPPSLSSGVFSSPAPDLPFSSCPLFLHRGFHALGLGIHGLGVREAKSRWTSDSRSSLLTLRLVSRRSVGRREGALMRDKRVKPIRRHM